MGDAGINYFANLIEAGRSDIAAVLQTLPSYARAVVVAEQNMRTLTLSPGMFESQLTALKQDVANPQIMKNAAWRARLQAESNLVGQRIDGGALDGLLPYQKARMPRQSITKIYRRWMRPVKRSKPQTKPTLRPAPSS